MLQIVLIRPGCTDFEEQGRIQGTLDIPLNEQGRQQVERMTAELAGLFSGEGGAEGSDTDVSAAGGEGDGDGIHGTFDEDRASASEQASAT